MMTQVFTGPPTITTHPTSQEVLFGVSVILTCEGTGNGSITHQWETRVKEGQWMKINNSNNTRLALQNLEKSYQYRCIVSNEAGRTYSNLAIITILSKHIRILLQQSPRFKMAWYAYVSMDLLKYKARNDRLQRISM